MSDDQLKAALAKMLPGVICFDAVGDMRWTWDSNASREDRDIFDTELLHLCSLVEQVTLANGQCPTQAGWLQYIIALQEICGEVPAISATWQQRATALAKIKNIEL